MNFDEPRTTLITCNRGVAEILRSELEQLNVPVESTQQSSVTCSATLADTMRLNLELRTAIAVQYEIATFRCEGPDDLYQGTRQIAWETIVEPTGYVNVTSHVDHPTINHSLFPSLRVKDAIVDHMMDCCHTRPDAGPDPERGIVVSIYWRGDRCRVYLNTSGRRLSDRGYRKRPGKAPLQETLAAAMLLTAGYDGSQPLVLPMCGSGTLAIEAALIAQKRAPGLLRSQYAFMHVVGFEAERWRALRQEVRTRSQKLKLQPAAIVATDADAAMVDAARHNAQTAGVEHLVTFDVCDFADTPLPDASDGIVILNPAYGQRLGDEAELRDTYARIGDFFKQRCAGYTGFVFTANRELAGNIGLSARRKHVFFHAGLDCRMFEYELYAGSRRTDRHTANQ